MSRLRGPKAVLPRADSPFLLNHELFGSHEYGGHTTEALENKSPIDWALKFGRVAPLEVEIGFNRGVFIEELASNCPSINVLGIEIQRRYCWRLANLLEDATHPFTNLKLIWADAKVVTSALMQPNSVDTIYINFPDPWWKKRHHKRRLVDTAFAQDLVQVLKPGGEIWVKSDVLAIADEIRDALLAVKSLERGAEYTKECKPLTHRERKCLDQGLEIYRFRFVKRIV